MNHAARRILAAGAATAALALSAAPAFAAAEPTPATAQSYQVNNLIANGKPVTPNLKGPAQSPVYTAAHMPSATATSVGEPGMTISGRANASTGLVYPTVEMSAPSTDYAGTVRVAVAGPVAGTTGINTLSTSAADLEVRCTSDAVGHANGAVSIASAVPILPTTTPAPNTTVHIGANKDITVVYNEQKTLANGQLQVTGMHVYYNVPDSGAAGSGAVTGDIAYGVVACGNAETAQAADEAAQVPLASAGAVGLVGIGALTGAATLVRRRTR